MVPTSPDKSLHPIISCFTIEHDTCVGCMHHSVDVKVRRSCSPHAAPHRNDGPVTSNTPCSDCFCRSFWCLGWYQQNPQPFFNLLQPHLSLLFSLGKWFHSKQDPRRPEEWFNGKAECPTCKGVFCVLDILFLDSVLLDTV